jgi:hypothetical protein
MVGSQNLLPVGRVLVEKSLPEFELGGRLHSAPRRGSHQPESEQIMKAKIIGTGGAWERFFIVSKSGSGLLYWDGGKWMPQQRNARLYADRESAEQDMEKLKATK